MDPRTFLQRPGKISDEVVVATAHMPAGGLFRMTTNSFNSVALDPPLILFSISRKTSSFQAWRSISY